jgi:hypothetical protein
MIEQPVKRPVGRPRGSQNGAKALGPVDRNRARYYKARAEKLERENLQALGKLINTEELNKRLASAFAIHRQKILESRASKAVQDELIAELADLKKNFLSSDLLTRYLGSQSA